MPRRNGASAWDKAFARALQKAPDCGCGPCLDLITENAKIRTGRGKSGPASIRRRLLRKHQAEIQHAPL